MKRGYRAVALNEKILGADVHYGSRMWRNWHLLPVETFCANLIGMTPAEAGEKYARGNREYLKNRIARKL
jgi:hypothetical protein